MEIRFYMRMLEEKKADGSPKLANLSSSITIGRRHKAFIANGYQKAQILSNERKQTLHPVFNHAVEPTSTQHNGVERFVK